MIEKVGPYELGRVHHADCLEAMRFLPDGCVDAVVTDPPYALTAASRRGSPRVNDPETPFGRTRLGSDKGFMGKTWDGALPPVEVWVEALRVAKPGAHLLAFGGTRTFHRLACAIEDAGWEIRDCLSWLYGQGFPKSLNVQQAINKAARGCPQGAADPESPNHGKFKGGCCEESPDGRGFGAGAGSFMREHGTARGADEGPWHGYGTALKPAWEPIILARKPLDGTVAQNVQAHGTGALNIDACRIQHASEADRASATPQGRVTGKSGALAGGSQNDMERSEFARPDVSLGRWPANLVLDEEAARVLDEQSGELASGLMRAGQQRTQDGGYNGGFPTTATAHDTPADRGGASRFFYCAKASRGERGDGNNHPTVKPLSLMRWLCRLVTPPGGVILDPFSGSGTTGCAGRLEGFRFVGFDMEVRYVKIANARIGASAERSGAVAPSQAKPGQQIGLLPTVG